MAQPAYIANWKMFHSWETAETWLKWWSRSPWQALPDEAITLVCPPTALIYPMVAAITGAQMGRLLVGGQDLHDEFKGAFTGAISGVSLWSVGAQGVLVGHSERRRHFGESDELVGRKLQQAYLCGLLPVLCVGETMDERDAGKTIDVVTRQLATALEGITEATLASRQTAAELPPLTVAYEPVWAIGSGRPATPELADEVLRIIRGWLSENIPGELSAQINLLYGGSVNPDNVAGFTATEQCDGVLVGSASLDPESFFALTAAGLQGQGYTIPEPAPAT